MTHHLKGLLRLLVPRIVCCLRISKWMGDEVNHDQAITLNVMHQLVEDLENNY